jgi:hypothetical protein
MGWEGGNCKSERAGTATAKRREQQEQKGGTTKVEKADLQGRMPTARPWLFRLFALAVPAFFAVVVPPFGRCSSRLVAFAVSALYY